MTDNEAMLEMMKPFLQSIFEEIMKAEPENDSVREQSNVLAVYLMNIPSIKEKAGAVFDAKTLAKVLYNLKQTDFDSLYHAFESAKKYRR
jgi:hypothetical protein